MFSLWFTELWVTVHWITMETCRIPYENAWRTEVRNLLPPYSSLCDGTAIPSGMLLYEDDTFIHLCFTFAFTNTLSFTFHLYVFLNWLAISIKQSMRAGTGPVTSLTSSIKSKARPHLHGIRNLAFGLIDSFRNVTGPVRPSSTDYCQSCEKCIPWN